VGANLDARNAKYANVFDLGLSTLDRPDANAWGVSLVVGVGTTSPQCPHHQAANLAGPSKVLYGAVVNGPNGADNFADLPFPAGAKERTRPYESFDGQGSRYADDLSSWPSNEPAIDFTSTALLAFSLAGRS
jgi:hypothetical protein